MFKVCPRTKFYTLKFSWFGSYHYQPWSQRKMSPERHSCSALYIRKTAAATELPHVRRLYCCLYGQGPEVIGDSVIPTSQVRTSAALFNTASTNLKNMALGGGGGGQWQCLHRVSVVNWFKIWKWRDTHIHTESRVNLSTSSYPPQARK
jgi:hypothetical protein